MPETAKVKNISGEDLIDGWSGGRLVEAGQAIEVPIDQVYGYTQQAERWEPFDNAAKKAHKAGTEEREARDAAEAGPADEQPEADTPEQPAPAGDSATPKES